jgi:predicted dinucleotide-binding enzyme
MESPSKVAIIGMGKIGTVLATNLVIILAVWFETIKDFFKKYRAELQGKIIIDPSNPLALAEGGGFKKIIDQDQSAGQLLSTLLPKGARLIH